MGTSRITLMPSTFSGSLSLSLSLARRDRSSPMLNLNLRAFLTLFQIGKVVSREGATTFCASD